MTSEKLNVGILFGGKSAEHEVSLQSAKNVIDAINRNKYNPVMIGINKEGRWLYNPDSARILLNSENPKLIGLNQSGESVSLVPDSKGKLCIKAGHDSFPKLDVIFPILHGPLGEDGTVQGLLKLAGLPFVGASVLGAAIGMDKDVMKRLLRDAGLPVARFMVLHSHDAVPDYNAVAEELGPVLFIKPANMGSSVGVSKVASSADFSKAIKSAFSFDRKIILESSVEGREIECAVLGNDSPMASIPGEVVPSHDFYSYDAKYIDEKGASLEIPARLTEQEVHRIQELAVETFKVLSCEGMARVDFFLTEGGEVLVNEINTIPGFTSISMYPMLWQASGISYADLIDRLIELALERHAVDSELLTSHSI